MTFAKIIDLLLILLICFQVAACQKKEGISEEAMPGILDLAKQAQAAEYESELSRFYFDESNLRSHLSDKNVPDPFKDLRLNTTIFYFDLDFKPDRFLSSTYVEFVDYLGFECDGKIQTIKYGYKTEITQYQLLNQIRWRPLSLKICGQISVPEGRKLLIYAKTESKIESLDIVTSPNSHLSLRFSNIEYSGTAPQISVAPNSILKLNFK